MGKCDKWTILRIFEVIFVGACLVFKRVTDDEAFSLFLYLQKLSREWSLLNNVTWGKVGASVADATYGGYFIITLALFIGKVSGDLPTRKRIAEYVLLSVGAILFIVLGSLEFAAIDSLPHNLIDNAAILGTLSVVIGALFLLDMGAPRAEKTQPIHITKKEVKVVNPPTQRISNGDRGNPQAQVKSITQQVYDIEKGIEESERDTFDEVDKSRPKSKKDTKNNGIKNGGITNNNQRDIGGPSGTESALKEFSMKPTRSYIHLDPTTRGYKQMQDEIDSQATHIPRPKFGIYGKDVMTFEDESETDDTATLPPKIELHHPVWSQLRRGRDSSERNIRILPPVPPVELPSQQPHYSSHDLFERPPSGPSDPGFVQYTAQHWGDKELRSSKLRTPKSSPTEERDEEAPRSDRRDRSSRLSSFYTGV